MAYEKIRFTKALVSALTAPDGRAYFSDTDCPGLTLMVTASGAKTFQLYVKHDGRPVRVTLGRFSPSLADSVELPRTIDHAEFLRNTPDLNVRMARELAARTRLDLKAGVNHADLKKAKREELTLGELFEEYMNGYLIPKKRKSLTELRRDFERLLGEVPKESRKAHGSERKKSPGSVNWQNRRISTITRAEIQRAANSIATRCSNDRANKALTLLNSMYNRAAELGLFKLPNPAAGLQKFKTKTRERFLQSDELPRFFAAIEAEPSADIRDYFKLCLLIGARKDNVLSMRWGDLALDRATWTVPGEFTKNGDPVELPLSTEALAILRSRKPARATTYVFPGRGASGHLANPRKGWLRLLDRDEVHQLALRIEAAGVPYPVNIDDRREPHFKPLAQAVTDARAMAAQLEIDTTHARLGNIRPHDLRRTLGSWQAIGGASLAVIGKSLGHKSMAATAVYARLSMDPVRGSVQGANDAMLAAAGIKPKE